MCVIPVQFKSQCSVDSGKPQESDPTKQNAAKNTWLEVENPNLKQDIEEKLYKYKRPQKETQDKLVSHTHSECFLFKR